MNHLHPRRFCPQSHVLLVSVENIGRNINFVLRTPRHHNALTSRDPLASEVDRSIIDRAFEWKAEDVAMTSPCRLEEKIQDSLS